MARRPLGFEISLPGTWSSSTMMVMMTAMTPSEKASRRPGERGLDMGSAGKNTTVLRGRRGASLGAAGGCAGAEEGK